jgi:undecaprenyl-phosphate 4-deoxy-4-formamido-L-arabinose transferase
MSETPDPAVGVVVSVVIPVYNEELVLTRFCDRLYPVLDGMGLSYEAVFVDDGSRDRSATLLRQQYKMRPDTTRVLYLRRNAGQDAAIMAGLAACVGQRIVTLDADLQDPPEEIPRLLAEMDQGHDYVGSIRRYRHEARWRESASRLMNRVRERITGVQMTDPGCMLRAYDRDIVDALLASREVHTFIPALAYLYSTNPAEILVGHEALAGEGARYPLYRLTARNFDLLTGFSLVPLQVFSRAGIAISLVSFGFAIYLALHWVIVGPEAEGSFALLGVLFFLAGVILFGIGLLGGYVGRIFEQCRGRPDVLVREELIPRPTAGAKGRQTGGVAAPGPKV